MENIELRCEEVRSILEKVPQGLVRWGIGTICSIWVFIILGSIFFRYPDIISAEAKITTEHPPVWLTSRVSGNIQELFVKHLQPVEKGEILAVLENTATTEDILYIKRLVSDSLFYDLETLVNHPQLIEKPLNPGELQAAWSNVISLYSDYEAFLRIDTYPIKIIALEEELKACRERFSALKRQESNQKQIFALVQERFKREKELHQEGIVSKDDFQEAQETVLNSKQTLEEIRYSIHSAQMEQIRLNQNLLEVKTEHQKSINDQQHRFHLAIRNLVSAIESWELNYLLQSPTKGIISFTENIHSQDRVNAGEKIFAIVSDLPGKLIGHLKFSSAGSGKVEEGQIVRIHIDGYPYMEFGSIEGRIQSTSLVSNANHLYSAKVSLPNRLMTTYKKQMVFRGELTGTAEIYTRDMRLIERILSPVRHLFHNMVR